VGDPKPTRSQGDLAEMLETLLDKGVVINADVAVSVGDTELLGVKVRAAIASFETAAEYGLEFPSGTDMERVEAAAATDVAARSSAVEGVEDGEAAPTDSTSTRERSVREPTAEDVVPSGLSREAGSDSDTGSDTADADLDGPDPTDPHSAGTAESASEPTPDADAGGDD
jgi:hypothetical protein